MSVAATAATLRSSDGFAVESQDGRLGQVEEVWLGPDDEPEALAVRRRDGRRGLLLAADVAAVEPDDRRLYMRPGSRLLELEAPRVGRDGHLTASWAASERPLPPLEHRRLPHLSVAAPQMRPAEKPLWVQVALLYGGIVVVVAVVLALTFLIAWAVAGSAT